MSWVGVGLAVAALTACSAGQSTDPASAASSSAAAALSSAAQASPGAYGSPVDPALPNPTSVATDQPPQIPTGASATVVLTFADWNEGTTAVEAAAFVQGVVESGGTCTLEASGPGSATATTSVQAQPDAGSTSCAGLSLPGDELAAGTWSVEVGYESVSTQGRSAAVQVVVP